MLRFQYTEYSCYMQHAVFRGPQQLLRMLNTMLLVVCCQVCMLFCHVMCCSSTINGQSISIPEPEYNLMISPWPVTCYWVVYCGGLCGCSLIMVYWRLSCRPIGLDPMSTVLVGMKTRIIMRKHELPVIVTTNKNHMVTMMVQNSLSVWRIYAQISPIFSHFEQVWDQGLNSCSVTL